MPTLIYKIKGKRNKVKKNIIHMACNMGFPVVKFITVNHKVIELNRLDCELLEIDFHIKKAY